MRQGSSSQESNQRQPRWGPTPPHVGHCKIFLASFHSDASKWSPVQPTDLCDLSQCEYSCSVKASEGCEQTYLWTYWDMIAILNWKTQHGIESCPVMDWWRVESVSRLSPSHRRREAQSPPSLQVNWSDVIGRWTKINIEEHFLEAPKRLCPTSNRTARLSMQPELQ